ncbi:MAG: DUF2523 family protein [Candidatus Competibacter denitrificans]|jgi:hypothetical protein
MANIAAWLFAIIGPLAKHLLTVLGFGFLVWKGLGTIRDQIASAVNSALSLIHPDIYQIVALAGFVDVIGIWLGAITAAVTVLGAKKLMAIL